MTQSVDESPRVVPHCSLSIDSFVWFASDGRCARTFVAKATYELKPGASPLAKFQDGVHAADVHWDGDPRSSLRAAADLVPYKPRVDVVVTGHAYAPNGYPVRSLFARLVVGPLSKTIAVFGDRAILPGGELSEPAEMDGIPLCWERAAGGPGTANPAGIPHDPFGHGEARARDAGQSLPRGDDVPPFRAPNFQPPGFFSSSTLDPIPPVGFGPIAADWPERADKLGPLASTFRAADWASRPLPRGLDAGYFNCAPADQQIDHFDPGMRILLENLHPEHARLVTHLEGIAPFAILRREGHADHRFDLICDTVWLDTDRGVCCLTFRGTIAEEAVAGAEIHLDVEPARASDETASPSGGASSGDVTGGEVTGRLEGTASPRAGASPGDVPGGEDTARIGDWPAAAMSARSAAESVVWIDESNLPSQLRHARDREPVQVPDLESTLTLHVLVPQTAPLPFGSSPAASAPVHPRAPAPDPTGTIAASLTFEAPPLPAGWKQPPPPPLHEAEPLAPPLTPPGPVTPVRTDAEDAEPPPDSDARTERPPPPPMLAAVVALSRREPLPSIPEEPATTALDPATVPLERWAEITAEVDKALRPRAEILRDRELSEQGFDAVDRRWKAALAREAECGGFAMRLASDAAYVGALERLRGRPLTAPEYAQILSAAERLSVPAALRDLEMPAPAHLPIVRLWTLQLARDPRLSQDMIQAVAALREGSAGQPAATA